MVGIEYSPNSRASCQKCYRKIKQGSVRVSTFAASTYGGRGEYIKQYTHAECYTNRKDFTKFYGFRDLYPQDQKRFMTEKQKRENYPQDYVEKKEVPKKVEVTYGGTMATAAASSANQNEFDDGLDDEELATLDLDAASKQAAAKKPSPSSSNVAIKQQPESQKETVLRVVKSGLVEMVGLKSAHARALPGEKVMLVRDPDNMYDSRAIKVINSSKQRVGYITSKFTGNAAAPVSDLIDKRNAELSALGSRRVDIMGTILDAGDGNKQTLQIEFKIIKIETNKNQSNAQVAAAAVDDVAGMTAEGPKVFTIVGLKYAEARASCGENVILIREPENKYDSNAIKVVNSSNQQIGHIKAANAGTTSKTWDSQNATLKSRGECIVAMGTILDLGNEYEQPVKVEFKRVPLSTEKTTEHTTKVAALDTTAVVLAPQTLTIVDLIFADAHVVSGEKVTLVRDIENKTEHNAIKVINSSKKYIGHIKSTQAIPISKSWDGINAGLKSKGQCMVATGTIIGGGDGYELSVRVEFKQVKVTNANTDQSVNEIATAGIGTGTPKVAKRSEAAVPVTVSSKKARRSEV